jgi:hypothetical protein
LKEKILYYINAIIKLIKIFYIYCECVIFKGNNFTLAEFVGLFRNNDYEERIKKHFSQQTKKKKKKKKKREQRILHINSQKVKKKKNGRSAIWLIHLNKDRGSGGGAREGEKSIIILRKNSHAARAKPWRL